MRAFGERAPATPHPRDLALEQRALMLYNYRDITYVDDIVYGVIQVTNRVPLTDASGVQDRVYKMGNHRSRPLLRCIWVTDALRANCGWAPTTPIDADLPRFVA